MFKVQKKVPERVLSPRTLMIKPESQNTRALGKIWDNYVDAMSIATLEYVCYMSANFNCTTQISLHHLIVVFC